MFRASLCPSSGEQEQDWLKFHVKMPGCAGCGCVEPGVGSVHFFKAVVRLQSHEVLTSLVLVLLMMGIMMPETC
jgi:hypothetical protein